MVADWTGWREVIRTEVYCPRTGCGYTELVAPVAAQVVARAHDKAHVCVCGGSGEGPIGRGEVCRVCMGTGERAVAVGAAPDDSEEQT